MMRSRKIKSAAFTLVELMVVVALLAVIAALAGPSLRDMILMQRLRGVQAQAVADMSFARSEAVSRANFVQVRFQSTTGSNGMTCYIIYSRANSQLTPDCDCTAAAGSRCVNAPGGPILLAEIRTVQLPTSESVQVVPATVLADKMTFDPRTGGLTIPPNDLEDPPRDPFEFEVLIDAARKFKDTVGVSGRITSCAPAGSTVGAEPC